MSTWSECCGATAWPRHPMLPEKPAKLLRIHISESHRHEGKLLYETSVDQCREMKIAGATVFRGIEGYGETAEMHRSHLMRHDQPVVVTIVDTAENIERLMPAIEKILDTGVMAVSAVRVVRVQ